MAKLNFVVKILPIGTNHAYSQSRNGRRFLTDQGKEYKESLGWSALECNPKGLRFKCPIVTLIFTYGDRRRRDVDSAIKLTIDAFNGVLWDDDSQIEELHVYKCYNKGNPSVEVLVEESLLPIGYETKA